MHSLARIRPILAVLVWFGLAVGAGAAGFSFTLPPNALTVQTLKRNNVFYVGQPVQFQLSAPTNSYQVHDYYGNLVDQNTIQGTAFTVKVFDPGWYKLDIFGTVNQGSPWGQLVGGTMFCIFRNKSGFPALPALDPNLYTYLDDEGIRGVTGMGPQRHYVSNVNDPTADIARLQQEIAIDKQLYLPYDPLRKRALLIAFPGGTTNLAGVLQVVQTFKNDVKYYEARNEPNFTYNGADFLNNELIPFYQTVKGVDPTLKVVGPGAVTIGPYGIAWAEQFLAAGGGNYIDAFSFHAYNNVNGDPFLTIQSLEGLDALLSRYNLGGIEKWQTEQGYMAAVIGAFQPRLQGRWTMLQMMIFEQYGIPKEHNHLWYDRARGFWDAPMWWENFDTSLMPAPALMRVWSEELQGTIFSRALSFGDPGAKIYYGSLFSGPGKSIATFMCGGGTDGHVDLKVSGGSSIHYVSPWGLEYDIPVVSGQVTIPVPELPVYVELAPGQTVDVVPVNWGPNLMLQPGVTGNSSTGGANPYSNIAQGYGKLFNQNLETWYFNQDDNDWPWMAAMDTTNGTWVELDLPSVQTVDRVVVYSSPPWQLWGTLVDYEMQYDNAGQWVTIDHVQEPTKTWNIYTPMASSTVDSYFSDRCVFQHAFPPVQTQKIRILVHNVTWGGGATQDVFNAGGQTAGQAVCLREVEAYNASSVGIVTGSSNGNLIPFVSLYAPADSSNYPAPANVTISAGAFEANGSIAKVEFFANGTKVGEVDSGQYTFAWNNVPAGQYLISARATDASGTTANSAPVYVTVGTATNAPPTASMTGPFDGTTVAAPASITLQAAAADSNGTVSKVVFLANNIKIGESLTAPYSFNWTGVASGTYSVSAKAYDNLGASGVSAPISITVTPATDAASATFVRNDTATRGNWKAIYGTEGYNVIGTIPSYPSYATIAPTGNSSYIWAPTTSNVLALQTPAGTGRIAGCWYSANDFTIDVKITDGQTHSVAIYALDWDAFGPRAETVQILDAATGAVLDSQSLPSFLNGAYLVWDVTGHVQIRVANVAANGNAVIGGVFFGRTSAIPNPLYASISSPANGSNVTAPWSTTITATAYNSVGTVAKVAFYSGATELGETTSAPYTYNWNNVLPGTYSLTAVVYDGLGNSATSAPVTVTVNPPVNAAGATYIKNDSITQGSWKGVYGSDGANVIGLTPNYPPYANVSSYGYGTWTWTLSTSNVAAVQKPSATDRIASCWYSSSSFIIDVNFTDGQTHGVAFYALDWDGFGPRTQTVSIVDAVTQAVVDTRNMPSFQSGNYLVWDVKGHFQIRVTNGNPNANAVISGLFFGPPTNSTPYQSWAAGIGLSGAKAGPTADYNGDGSTNLLKWAFGTSPLVSSPGSLAVSGSTLTQRGRPTTLLASDGISHLAAFGRRMNYVTSGLTYIVQFSNDLSTWTNSTVTPTPIANDGVIEVVTVPYPPPPTGKSATYFRVNVSTQ